MRIGDLASAGGLTPDAIRYYERRGLVPRPRRTSGGFREYESSTVDRLRFIKQAQAHGLTLAEVRELVACLDKGGQCRRVHDLLSVKLAQLETRRAELDDFCRTLRAYRDMCERALERSADVDCPVVADMVKR